MFCPAVSLLALAFADSALKEDGIQCLEDLLHLRYHILRKRSRSNRSRDF